MAQNENQGLPRLVGWMTGTVFGKYVRYHADLKEKDPGALWAERFRKYEESVLGYDIPRIYQGPIVGAKDAVVELGKNDPVLVAETAMKFLNKIPLSEQQKKEFAVGFNTGFDKDDLVRYIEAHTQKK